MIKKASQWRFADLDTKQPVTKRPRQTPLSPLHVRRVGGGYDIVLASAGGGDAGASAAAAEASASAGRLLQGLEGPLCEQDLLIIRHILRTADLTAVKDCESGHATSSRITLAKLLQAYEVVLPQHGLLPQEDTHFYRILLKLTLDPNHDWWQRFHKETKLWSRKHSDAAKANSSKRGGIAARPPAAAAAAKWHSSTSSKARSRAGAAVAGSIAAAKRRPANAAMHVATVAVDAATAAVAAAWADARMCNRSRSSLPSTAWRAGPQASIEASTGPAPQASCSLGSWNGMNAEPSACCTWQSVGHDTLLSQTVAAAVIAAADAGSRQGVGRGRDNCPLQHAAAADVQHSSSCWHSSPHMPPRAASAASLRSQHDGLHLAGIINGHTASPEAQRCKSTSPCLGLRRRSNNSSSCIHVAPDVLGRHSSTTSSSISPGIVHEFPCSGCCSATCTCSCDAVAHVHAPHAVSQAQGTAFRPVPRDAVLSEAVLAAGQRDRLWKCLELHSPTAAKAAQQQQQQQQQLAIKRLQQRQAGMAGHAAELQLEASEEEQLSAAHLQPYTAFVAYMAIQHNWRASSLSAHITRDVLAAAEQRWLLAMSFWEVHAAWRCFARWRKLAAAAAEASSRHRRHWLLLCSFQWWCRMTQHYQRQQQAAGGQPLSSPLQQTLQDASRPSSPLTGLTRLLQQHPSLRPPCSPAGEMRQQACGRVLATYAFAAWLGVAQQKAEQKQLQEQLAWHHVQHVQAGVWNKWRVVFEQQVPQHKLMRAVYRTRRHSTLRKALKRWRAWAPVKHAKRRHLRAAAMKLCSSKRRRVWKCLQEYTAKRRVKSAAKQQAQQHFRRACLAKFLAFWLHALEIAAAFEELADTCWSKLLNRQSQAMLVWWRQLVLERQRRQELLESSCYHMDAYTVHRCMAAWQARVHRKQLLQDLLQQGLVLSEQLAAKAAFRVWFERTERRKRHASIMQAATSALQQRRLVAVWLSWLEYVAGRQQRQQLLQELSTRNQLFVWRRHLTIWQGLLHQRFRLEQAVTALQSNTTKRCAQHWKAWVDRKADWRAFQARASQHMAVIRLSSILRLWRGCAYQQSMLRELLAAFLHRRQLRLQQQAFDGWRRYLLARVAKCMNELSALLQWEQSMSRKAWRVWQARTSVWRYKRQQLLRADSYRALRLLDLALTSWSSVWAEGQEFAQMAAFFLAGKQSELRVLVLRAWGPEAARLRLKREHLEIARMHCVVTRQQQVLNAWRSEAVRRLRLHSLLGAAVQCWSQLTVSRAFQQWKDWALHQASLQRRMRAVVSMMMGRTLQWAFCMMREHALRKRRSRSARHHWQRSVAAAALRAWRQLAADAASFRGVLQDVGQRMQMGLLSELFDSWRDVLRAAQWKQANMMRALMIWGGSRKHLCFQTWRQWVQLKQGKKASLRQALRHWQHSHMTHALGFWQYYTRRKQVERRVLLHFRTRYLTAAFDAWHRWQRRKSYLAAVFAQLEGRGHQQVTLVVWHAWRSFVPQAQVKRGAKIRAAVHWNRRALILAFAWWHEYAAALRSQRQQLAGALMRWDTRRLWVALSGWWAVTRHKQHRRGQLMQGIGNRRLMVLSAAFKAWRQETELQLYRRQVVLVVGRKVNNGLLLKAFNCWRDVAEGKRVRRQQLASALTAWWINTQRRAFDAWLDNAHAAIATRQADAWRYRKLLTHTFTAWREFVLVRQQHSIIMRMVSNKRVSRLLVEAWTAWREVIDLRHQVAGRLRAVAQGRAFDQLWLSFDTWRQWALLKNLGRLAVQRWRTKQQASCWTAWRLWAAARQSSAHRVAVSQEASARRLATAVLRQWAALSWLLPREQRATALAVSWLQHRALRGWRQWLQERRRWHQLGDSLAAQWTNLHLGAAWQAWRTWVQRRQDKAQLASSITKRWTNLHLAAAFQAWMELVQVAHRHKAAVRTIAGRWRNLHTAAAFGAWCSFVAQRRRHRTAATAVAKRWQNLRLATAFSCWRQSVTEAAGRAAAADALAARLAAALASNAFHEWRCIAARKARLRRQASEVTDRQQRLYKELAYGSWKEVVQWRAAKRVADAHWRQVVLRSLLVLWCQHAQKKAGYQKTAAVVQRRTHQQLLRRSLISWQLYVQSRRQKATADSFAASRRQQQVFLAWAGLPCQTRTKADAAVNLAAKIQARVYNQLLYQCFAAWRTEVARGAAIKAVVLRFSTSRLRTYLHGWQQQARTLAGAAHLLRRLMAVTVRGAFLEWRGVAQEQAHWRRVEHHLVTYLHMDDTGAAARAIKAVLRWCNLPLWAAFASWRQAARDGVLARSNEFKAEKFLQLALALKALTGLRWRVQEGKVDRAAATHRGGAVKKAALRGWQQVAVYLQEKHQKRVAAAYTWSRKTKHKAFTALLRHAQVRVMRHQQTVAARYHCTLRRKASVFVAWNGLARYLAPIRRTLDAISSKRHHRSKRQLFAGWRLVCHRSSLLQMARGRLRQRVLSAALQSWRSVVAVKMQRKSLLHVAVGRLSHLLLARAFTRWLEAAHALKELRARAQQVLRSTLHRRMRGALTVWLGYVEYQEAKGDMMAMAERHWCNLYASHSITAWSAFVKEERQFAALSEQMLMRRQHKQRGVLLRWWHLIAQDLHHHRAVLASFRARHVRQEGLAVFNLWRDWAHWRTLERRAIVAHWHKLMLLAFATWKQHHEDLLQDKAVAHDNRRHTARALAAWQLGVALIHRKRSLTAAAVQQCRAHRMRHSLSVWMRFTYYKHMGHVVLHFRVRRLACVVLREWQEAACVRRQERSTAQLLTHQLAVNCATRLLTGWQQTLRARAHWRHRTLQGCLSYWDYWAPTHRARHAGWRAAAQVLAAHKLARCFYCWRWYCQVRLLREVAFQNKQRAIREALAVGEQVARRRRAALLASSFMAWHVQVSKYHAVAQKLAGLLHRNLDTCFRSWREATDRARVNLLRAQRQHHTNTLSRVLPAWQNVAAEARDQREAAEAAADKLWRRQLLSRACGGWVEEMAVLQAQRQGLWRLMLVLLGRERQHLLQAALEEWRAWVIDRVSLRTCVAGFVNKRRLGCLAEFLTLWQQYAAAMRGSKEEGAVTAGLLLHQSLTTPAPLPHSRMSPAVMTGCHTWPGLNHSCSRQGSPVCGRSCSPQAAPRDAKHHVGAEVHDPGVLPVSGGPGSPFLGPRSAQQDRRLARRLAAMGGGAPEVDAGSDDEGQLLQGLPATEAALSAAERQARQQPLLALSRGYTQRRVTLDGGRAQYDDAVEAAEAGLPSPRWDLHSVAESMQQAHTLGLSPWQLPTVHTSPPAKAPAINSLNLDELRRYQQRYPYSLQQQWQQQHHQLTKEQQARQHLLHVSQQQPIGRPSSAGACCDYQPLLQQQLMLQEELVWQQRQQPLPWEQHSPTSHQHGMQHQQHQQHIPAEEPWHVGKSRWLSPAAAVVHWTDRRPASQTAALLPADSSNGSTTGSRSSSPSTASAVAGSQAGQLGRQQHFGKDVALRKCHHWADKAHARESASDPPTDSSRQAGGQPALPSFNGQQLPRELAALLHSGRGRHTC